MRPGIVYVLGLNCITSPLQCVVPDEQVHIFMYFNIKQRIPFVEVYMLIFVLL